MIFKNEGEQRIQRMTAETTRSEADPGRPFDYRNELTESIKQRMYAALEGRHTAPTVTSYMRLAGAMKAVELPLPPRIDMNLLVINRVSEYLEQWSQQFSATTSLLKTYALVSVSEIVTHPKYPAFLTTLQRRAENGSSSFGECVLLRLLAPHSPQAKFSVRQLETLQKIKLAAAHRGAREILSVFEGIADAKVSGAFSGSPLDADDWMRVREFYDKCLKADNMTDVARIAFYSRVMNATDIRFDENGMHIIDPVLEVTLPTATQKTMPERRNI